MAQLITPTGGYTNQAQQNQSLADTLATITGSPAGGALLAASQTGPNYSNTPVPQLANSEDAMRTLFAHDQALAAQYSNPNLYGGGATPPANNPAGFASSPLQATIDSITNPQGAVTPQGITGQVSGDVSGQKDTLSNIMNALDFNQGRTLDAYKAMLSALGTVYSEQEQNRRQSQSLAANAKQVVSGPDGFYVVDVNNPTQAVKIISKPGKWSVNNNIPTYVLGIKTGNETVYNYTPPDGSSPSTFVMGQKVTLMNPDNPNETIQATVGSARFDTAQKNGWIPQL